MPDLNVVSYLAPNMYPAYEALSALLGRALGMRAHLTASVYDPLDDPAMDADQVDVAFMCGLPLARREAAAPGKLVALAAPIMLSARYDGQAVYFADVVVRAESEARHFEDLRGKRLCFNDPGSNSGYNLLRNRMLQAGLTQGFFGSVVQSGGHQKSIGMIVNGYADCSAIDSTVLEQAYRDLPELAGKLRIVESIGPCPMPPIAAAARLGTAALAQAQAALLDAHNDPATNAVLRRHGIARLVAAQNADYAPLAAMHQAAINAGFAAIR